VPACDPAGLAGALLEAVRAWGERGAWRVRQQRARRRIVDSFGIERMVQRYRSVWAQAAHRVD
jgi:hypothetical protein